MVQLRMQGLSQNVILAKYKKWNIQTLYQYQRMVGDKAILTNVWKEENAKV